MLFWEVTVFFLVFSVLTLLFLEVSGWFEMDIGQGESPVAPGAQSAEKTFKPFARPKKKRRRTLPSKPTVIAVRPNPPHYVLNFVDGDGPERSLLSTTLSNKRTVSLVGLPGSGKSVILRGLAYNTSITSTFRDGVFLVPLSQLTTVTLLFEYFLEVLDKMEAVIVKEEVKMVSSKGEEGQLQALDLILSSMREKRFLLLFDNLSEGWGAVYKVITTMTDMVPRGRRYTFICSTRSHEVAKKFSNGATVEVQLYEPTGDTARDILCAYSELERAQVDALCEKSGNSVIPVMRRCSGMPLALAVAGGAVKRLLRSNPPNTAKDIVWNHYWTYMNVQFIQFGRVSGLFTSFSSCVDSVPRDKDWKTDLSVWEVFCSLSVIQHGVWVPYPILQRLWSMKKKDDVISVVRPLSRHCLIQRERHGSAVGIVMADLMLDYCRHEATNRGGIRKWHIRLLSSYLEQPEVVGTKRSTAEGVEESQYLHDNLQHHLVQATVKIDGDTTDLEQVQNVVNKAHQAVQLQFFPMQLTINKVVEIQPEAIKNNPVQDVKVEISGTPKEKNTAVVSSSGASEKNADATEEKPNSTDKSRATNVQSNASSRTVYILND